MQCLHCQQENPLEANFCLNCGWHTPCRLGLKRAFEMPIFPVSTPESDMLLGAQGGKACTIIFCSTRRIKLPRLP